MKGQYRDIKKIIWMKWIFLTFTKDVTRQKQQRQLQKSPKSGCHLFLREQLERITGEDRKKYRSIVSKRWKEIKEDLEKLSAYNDRVKQMKNEAEKPGDDSQNEKTAANRPAVGLPQNAPKTPEFVDTDSNTKDEKEPVVKHPEKPPTSLGFVDTGSSTENEQGPVVKHPKNHQSP